MKRIGQWLLFLAATTCLTHTVNALKATSLIFGKVPNSLTTSTTSTPVVGSNATVPKSMADEKSTDDEDDEDEATKVPLTGIPQIDYVFDPNLPRELNGFNLSTYPFLSLVPDPEEIDFKCDGLHDGFYASIKYSCQLYHHCIYGVRHDFLCANFTAFDQKTFICQFVSVVDCKSSAKYWFRNDALYQAATTTTTTTTTVAPPPTQPTERPYRRPIRPVRPLRRRRPQIDYYYDEEELDDYYYDDEPVSRRKPLRTRNRRPIQDADDYDAPLPSRGGAYNYDDEDDYQPAGKRRPYDQQSRNRNRNSEKRRYNEDSRDDRRYYDSNKRHNADVDERRPLPANEDGPSERRRYRNRRPTVADDNVPSPRSRDRENPRPIQRDDRDDEAPYRSTYDNDSPREAAGPKIRPTGSGSSIFKAPRPPPKINRPVPANEKKKFEYIRPDKATEDDADYEVSFVKYKPARDEVVDDGEKVTGRRDQGVVHNSQTKTDEYEDEDLPPPPATSVINRNFKPSRRNPDPPIEEVKPRKSQSSRHQAPVRVREEEIEDVADYEEEETTPAAKKYNKYSSRSVLRKPAAARQPDDFEASAPGHTAPASRHNTNDEYDTVRNQRDSPKGYAPRNPPIIMQRLSQRESQRQAAVAAANIEKEVEAAESRKTIDKSSQLPANEKSAAKDEKDFSTPRTVKRPFLPSRGGSPYLPRGLKPVGAAQNISTEPPSTTAEPTDAIPEIVTEPMLPVMSPAPPPTSTQKIDVPIFDNDPTSGPSAPYDDYSEEVQESPKQTLEKIYNSEYDAALNDALNPTLKPLTLSSVSPIGFSLSNKFDRSRGSIYHQPSAYDSISRSSSQLYKTFLQQPSSQLAAKSVPYQSQQSQLPFYDDYEY